jgi:hypothetical protein
MAPATEPGEKNGEQEEAGELHVEHGAKSADAVGSEAREKIRAAPGKSRQQAQQNSHDGLRGSARFGGLAFLRFEAKNGHDFLQVFPNFAFCAGIAQQIGGVIGGHQFSAAKFEPLAAELRDAAVRRENGLRGGASEADDYFWRDGINLAQEEWRTLLDFVSFRRAIFRRAAFDDVADVNVLALQAHRFNHLRQKFSSAANEGKALHVFIVAGAFADENELGFGIAVAEDDFIPRGMKFAACAFTKVGTNLEQIIVGNFVKGFEQRWRRGDGQQVWLRRRLRRRG